MNIYTIFLFLLQGFNRLVAIALLFMAEEDAFWCLVYIIEQLMPAEYYSRDKQLIGAQVDQVSTNLRWVLLGPGHGQPPRNPRFWVAH